jgi:hypothetical protein
MFVVSYVPSEGCTGDIRHDLLVVEIILLPKTILARQLLRIVSISHFGDWAYCPAAIREQKITLGHLRVGWYLKALKSVFHGFICPFRGYVPFSDISSQSSRSSCPKRDHVGHEMGVRSVLGLPFREKLE